MRIVIEKVLSSNWVRIRKGKLRGIKLLAKDVKHKTNLEKILKSDIGYIDFKHIHISPYYLDQIKKNIFAMICQLGPPTFFFTFTSANYQWNHLATTLTKLYGKRKKIKHIETIEKCDIDYPMRKYLVTCASSYRHRIPSLKQLFCYDETFFGKILHFYFVIEFQNRGSAHEHGLLWIENSPIYGKNSNLEINFFSTNT